MVVCEGDELLPEHLPVSMGTPRTTPRSDATGSQRENGEMPTLEELERKHIKMALEASEGNRGHAARILGISERNLYRKLKDYRLLVLRCGAVKLAAYCLGRPSPIACARFRISLLVVQLAIYKHWPPGRGP